MIASEGNITLYKAIVLNGQRSFSSRQNGLCCGSHDDRSTCFIHECSGLSGARHEIDCAAWGSYVAAIAEGVAVSDHHKAKIRNPASLNRSCVYSGIAIPRNGDSGTAIVGFYRAVVRDTCPVPVCGHAIGKWPAIADDADRAIVDHCAAAAHIDGGSDSREPCGLVKTYGDAIARGGDVCRFRIGRIRIAHDCRIRARRCDGSGPACQITLRKRRRWRAARKDAQRSRRRDSLIFLFEVPQP